VSFPPGGLGVLAFAPFLSYNDSPVPHSELEQALRDLPAIGTMVKDRGYRQIWRFEVAGRAYFLKFYPRGGGRDAARRLFRGSPAVREFTRLQQMQKAQIPAPRAAAVLMGLKIKGVKGDAVILHAIEPSVQLDHYLADFQSRGEPVPNRSQLALQVRQVVHQLGRAGLGHGDLHLGNFLLSNGQVYLLDGYAVRPSGLQMSDVMQLGHSVESFATRTEVLRGWQLLGPGTKMPRRNGMARTLIRRYVQRIFGENRYFGLLRFDEPANAAKPQAATNAARAGQPRAVSQHRPPAHNNWTGVYFKYFKFPKRWSAVSKLQLTERDWKTAWPALLGQIEADTLKVIKRSRSGDVLSGEVILNGRPVPVIVKRAKRRYWYRYLNEIGRGVRARREWRKAWEAIARNLPTAWPLAFFERRVMGYVVDAMIIYEHIPGPTLGNIDLDAMTAPDREKLFRRTGKLLRRIESFGFSHFDAKASNWIVQFDNQLGPQPILIDIDGIRFRRWKELGVRRLLRSMKERKAFTEADSLALREGYAPYSPDVVKNLM